MRMKLNNKGFTLLEVMVTVGILAVISGIAVPQYNKYKENAGYQAVGVDLQTIRKQFGVCMAVNSAVGSCTTASQLDINISGFAQVTFDDPANATKFCAVIDRSISGRDVKSCTEVEVDTGKVIKTTANRKFCYEDDGAGGHDSNDAQDTDEPTEWGKGACDENSDCGSGKWKCGTVKAGTCASGVCS